MSKQRPRSALRRSVGLYGVALIPLLGLAELGAHFHFARRAPAFEAWQQIVEPVGDMREPGDLVVVAPRWAEPMARRALAQEVMPLGDLARADTRRHRTALEVSILGERDPELVGWRELERRQHGEFELRRLENLAYVPIGFDFVAAVAPEHLRVDIGPRAAPCPYRETAPVRAGGLGGHPTFPRQRFECPGSPFLNVGVTVIADQDFRPRRCIWAHPPARGPLRLTYRNVDLGEVIAGYSGMYWIVERERKGTPVEVTVRVDGESIGRFVHHDGEGWAGFELALGEHAGAHGAEVQFAVTSRNNRHRHFCFEAHTR